MSATEYRCLTDGPQLCWAFTEPPPGFAALSLTSGCEQTFLGMCLVATGQQDAGIFGFAEFVQAFALFVLVYTVTDTRYRFRISVAPIPSALSHSSSPALSASVLSPPMSCLLSDSLCPASLQTR